jgi:hypothetical protein
MAGPREKTESEEKAAVVNQYTIDADEKSEKAKGSDIAAGTGPIETTESVKAAKLEEAKLTDTLHNNPEAISPTVRAEREDAENKLKA